MKIWELLICILILLILFPVSGFGQWTEQKGVTVTVRVPGTSTEPVIEMPPGSGPGGPAPTQSAIVLFMGKSSPGAFITITQNQQVAGTFRVDSTGEFEQRLVVLTAGTYAFGLWAEDRGHFKSDTLNFTVDLLAGRTTEISRIFLPSTIAVKPLEVVQGEKIYFWGEAFPNSNIYLWVSASQLLHLLKSDSEGRWNYQLNSSSFLEGSYQVKVQVQDSYGEQSPFTNPISFSVLKRPIVVKPPIIKSKCQGADFNGDGKVDLVDFSILLYYWEKSPIENICVDLNSDGKVDLVDFSILLYYWTD